jgi:septal ring factor EnvC (AmiA/AmiB activator)
MGISANQSSILDELLSLVSRSEGDFKDIRTKIEEALDNAKKAEELGKTELGAKEEEINRLKTENSQMTSKLKDIEDQLTKISKTYQDLSGKFTEAVDVRELLTIYVTLLEEVFEGRPHAKILWLLHGKKAVLNRDEINKSSGFQPAIVLKSIYDLANAGLINYNDTTQELSLKRKLY